MINSFVIGDIHGCHRALVNLFDKITPDPDHDTIIMLGDYIDRGPDSKKVVAEIIRIKDRFRQVVTLMGNHEQMLLNYLAGNDTTGLYLMQGGRQTIKSYGSSDLSPARLLQAIPPEHRQFFSELLPCWQDTENIYVHAGLQPGVRLAAQSPDWLLWARQDFIDSDHDFDKRVVYGHTHYREPRVESNKIGIDTGAVYGNFLTCLILPELKFIQVKTSRFWPEPYSS